jgi:hypothetical protein
MVEKTEVEQVALDLFAVLREAGPGAIVDGEPLAPSYFENGELFSGVLLDGEFDFMKAAKALIERMEKRSVP